MSEWWTSTVRVMLSNNTAWNVGTNEQAADILLHRWPVATGERYLRARQAVLRSMERPDDPGASYAARQAFEAAAREADILVER